MANRCVLTGRLTADPELRHAGNDNIPVTSFRIAVPRKFKKDDADFINIVAWRKSAVTVCKYFSKGKWIEIDGSIQTRDYTDKESNKRTAFKVVADHVGFVGDKLKDDAAASNTAPSPPQGAAAAPPGFDPFAGATAPPPPAYSGYYSGSGDLSGGADFTELGEPEDLPF